MLEQLGLDTSSEKPKVLTRETVAASTMAITLGCGEECPYVPGVTYVDWPVADPGGQDEATVRAIIADLDARVRGLLVELVPDIELPPSSPRRPLTAPARAYAISTAATAARPASTRNASAYEPSRSASMAPTNGAAAAATRAGAVRMPLRVP